MKLTLCVRSATVALLGLLTLVVAVPIAAAQSAGLHLRLDGSPRSTVVGQQVTYSATIFNRSGRAAAAAVRDRLPSKASLVSTTASQGSCASGSPVVCDLGSLAAGGSATVTITALANQAGLLVDRAWVAPLPGGRWRHEHLVVTRVRPAASELDLRLAGSPQAVTVGQQVSYTATVSNDGPATVSSAAFQDVLPGKASLVSATASQGSCASSSPVVCDLGSLAAGGSATVTITATADADGLMVDRGWVSANPPGNWRHEHLVVTRVRPAASELDLRLAGSPQAVTVGQQVSYTATVSNDGPATVSSAAFQDVLPGKASLVSATASQGSCASGSPVVCDLGSLAAGASATVTVTVTAQDAGAMVDQGWVSANPPGNWRRERLAVTRVAPAAALLELRLSGSPGSVVVGQQVSYTATVSNGGPASVSSAAFQDVLPGAASLVSATASQGSCASGSPVVCDLGSLAAGASATVTVTVTTSAAGLIIDRGWVSANPPGNWRHEQIALTRVTPAAAELDLRLAGSPGSVVVGQQVTYTATVSNSGPATISNAAFEDVLPGKASLVSASASQGSCASGSPVVCDLGPLAAGASATITVVATVNAAGPMVDRGWVSANPPGHWVDEQLAVTLGERPPHGETQTVTTGTVTNPKVTTTGTTQTTTTGTSTTATATTATTGTTTTTETTTAH